MCFCGGAPAQPAAPGNSPGSLEQGCPDCSLVSLAGVCSRGAATAGGAEQSCAALHEQGGGSSFWAVAGGGKAKGCKRQQGQHVLTGIVCKAVHGIRCFACLVRTLHSSAVLQLLLQSEQVSMLNQKVTAVFLCAAWSKQPAGSISDSPLWHLLQRLLYSRNSSQFLVLQRLLQSYKSAAFPGWRCAVQVTQAMQVCIQQTVG